MDKVVVMAHSTEYVVAIDLIQVGNAMDQLNSKKFAIFAIVRLGTKITELESVVNMIVFIMAAEPTPGFLI